MRRRCRSCGGTYAAVLPDGLQYFHACPPLSRPELAAAVAAGTVVLPIGETVDDALARRPYVRARARDENVPSTRAEDAGKIKAPGAGVTTIPDPPPLSVVEPSPDV